MGKLWQTEKMLAAIARGAEAYACWTRSATNCAPICSALSATYMMATRHTIHICTWHQLSAQEKYCASINCWRIWECVSPTRRSQSEYILVTSTHLFTELSTVNVDNFLMLIRLLPLFSLQT